MGITPTSTYISYPASAVRFTHTGLWEINLTLNLKWILNSGESFKWGNLTIRAYEATAEPATATSFAGMYYISERCGRIDSNSPTSFTMTERYFGVKDNWFCLWYYFYLGGTTVSTVQPQLTEGSNLSLRFVSQ